MHSSVSQIELGFQRNTLQLHTHTVQIASAESWKILKPASLQIQIRFQRKYSSKSSLRNPFQADHSKWRLSDHWKSAESRNTRIKFKEIHWCWLSDHQKVPVTNVKSRSREIRLPNWNKYDGNLVVSANGQTGGGTKSALALF